LRLCWGLRGRLDRTVSHHHFDPLIPWIAATGLAGLFGRGNDFSRWRTCTRLRFGWRSCIFPRATKLIDGLDFPKVEEQLGGVEVGEGSHDLRRIRGARVLGEGSLRPGGAVSLFYAWRNDIEDFDGEKHGNVEKLADGTLRPAGSVG